jgi:uncharacterized protein YbbC (DUF1343 family)
VQFQPNDSRYRGQTCQGVRIEVVDRKQLDAPMLGIALISVLQARYAGRFELDATTSMVGDPALIEAIRTGAEPAALAASWAARLDEFKQMRAAYLLY